MYPEKVSELVAWKLMLRLLRAPCNGMGGGYLWVEMTREELLDNLESRICALVSHALDKETIKSLDRDVCLRLFWSTAFSRVLSGRMILEFLEVGYSEKKGLFPKPPVSDPASPNYYDYKISNVGAGLVPVDTTALPLTDKLTLVGFYSASHKLVHFTDDPKYVADLTKNVDDGIPLILRFLNQHFYKRIGVAMPIAGFKMTMDKEQPGWDQ